MCMMSNEGSPVQNPHPAPMSVVPGLRNLLIYHGFANSGLDSSTSKSARQDSHITFCFGPLGVEV